MLRTGRRPDGNCCIDRLVKFAKRYQGFAKPGRSFDNSKALSEYMYGKVEGEFVDAMTEVIGDKGIKDMTDHVNAAIDTLSKALKDYVVPELF